MATSINLQLPPEIITMILAHAISPPQIHPSGTDSLINDLKFCTDDCELAAEYADFIKQQTYSKVSHVCHLWNLIMPKIPRPSEKWIILHDEGGIPFASRVHYPKAGGCQCLLPDCSISQPPPTMVTTHSGEPIKAFVESRLLPRDTGKMITKEDTLTRSISGQTTSIQDPSAQSKPICHPELRLLAFAPDFASDTPFSLPVLSTACPNLTHLRLLEFFLPTDDTTDQTLDLPRLTTLTLDFWYQEDSPIDTDGDSQYDSASSSQGDTVNDAKTVLHPSIQQWNLPALRHLGIEGWVSEPESLLFNDIDGLLRREGHKLEGLLYNVWTRSESGSNAPRRIPPHLWEWCPKLHSIQTSLAVLFSGRNPPPSHPRLTITPISLLDLQNMGDLLWPVDLYHRLPLPTEWSIERLCAPTTWATFHRKLLRLERESNSYWREYFREWLRAALQKGYVCEDRYGVDVREGSGKVLLRWLGVPVDGD